MTRNRELDCKDLFECDHQPETPISRKGEILYWVCRCGRRFKPPEVQALAPPGNQTSCDHEVGYRVCDGKGNTTHQVCRLCSVSLPVDYPGPSAVLAIVRGLRIQSAGNESGRR